MYEPSRCRLRANSPTQFHKRCIHSSSSQLAAVSWERVVRMRAYRCTVRRVRNLASVCRVRGEDHSLAASLTMDVGRGGNLPSHQAMIGPGPSGLNLRAMSYWEACGNGMRKWDARLTGVTTSTTTTTSRGSDNVAWGCGERAETEAALSEAGGERAEKAETEATRAE